MEPIYNILMASTLKRIKRSNKEEKTLQSGKLPPLQVCSEQIPVTPTCSCKDKQLAHEDVCTCMKCVPKSDLVYHFPCCL